MNLITDALIQPIVTSGVEIALWGAIFASTGHTLMAGYPREMYLSYALWAAFFARISTNWMYEYSMIDDIDTGAVNSCLTRPISFYEYYLGQFMGYKFLTALISLIAPVIVLIFWPQAAIWWRLPIAFLLSMYYLILVYTLSFAVASLGFFLNRVHSFTGAKNVALAMITGELFPLDLIPEPFRHWILLLPFANGVYVPVGYLTGRLQLAAIGNGFVSTTIGILAIGLIAQTLWHAGRKQYSGTGA